MDVSTHAAAGTVIGGRYRLVRRIGAGGVGEVWEAEQIDLARRVAVKLLRGVDATAVARLRREAETAGALHHPHVVSVLEVQANAGETPFLAMELLEGEPLAALGKREAPIEPRRAVRLALQILSGLDAAHRAGLVHRDVKPGNVWVTRTLSGEMVKLLDFGLVLAEGPRMTQTGHLVGTPQFMAPEQVRGERVDARADLHAVGLVLTMLLAGKLPWAPDASPHAEVLLTVPPSLDTVVPGLPKGLAAVVARALEKDPRARYATAAEMYEALAPFAEGAKAPGRAAPTLVSGTPPPAPAAAPPKPAARARRRSSSRTVFGVALLASLLVAAAVVALGALWIASSRRVATPAEAAAPEVVTAQPTAPAPEPSGGDDAEAAPAPTASEEPKRPAAPRAPGLRFATAKDPTSCACIADISPSRTRRALFAVCPIPMPTVCTCEAASASFLCQGTYDAAGNCSDSRVLASEEGKPCAGSLRGYDGTPVPGTGTVRCYHCRGNARYVGPTHGAPCRGIHDGAKGQTFDGAWDCTR